MTRKPAHPNIELFNYLNGSLEAGAAQGVQAHLSVCAECASAAKLVRALKEEASERNHASPSRISSPRSRINGEHPDISELASFFHDKSRRKDSSQVAAHVALCGQCAEAIAIYAGGERAASDYDSNKPATGEVPSSAWEMIHEWEASSLAKLKPETEILGTEMLTRLSVVLRKRDEWLSAASHQTTGSQRPATPGTRERVPVFVISGSGEVRGVELFEKTTDSAGDQVLRHAEGSGRFDNKAVHLLLDFGGTRPIVVSDLVRRGAIRQQQQQTEDKLLHADYFIVED